MVALARKLLIALSRDMSPMARSRRVRGEPRVCAMTVPPSPSEEDRRRISRERATLLRERIRHTNRIRGLLFGQGITTTIRCPRSRGALSCHDPVARIAGNRKGVEGVLCRHNPPQQQAVEIWLMLRH
jgi:hypothetical protein